MSTFMQVSKKGNTSNMSNEGKRYRKGVTPVFYRRKESFRFTFESPEISTVHFQSNAYIFDLMNISPRGARLFSTVRFEEYSSEEVIQLNVTLFKKEMQIEANIVWTRPSRDGTLIGLQFLKIETDVISELKLRRYKELEEEFHLKGKRFY